MTTPFPHDEDYDHDDDINGVPRILVDEEEPRETARSRWLDSVDSGTNREYL